MKLENEILFLTWNYHKENNDLKNRALKDIITDKGKEIDVVILQESYDISLINLISQTHEEIPTDKYPIGQGVRILVRKNTFEYSDPQRSNRNKLFLVSMRKLTSANWFTLAGVHFYSKRSRTERMQMWGNVDIINNIMNYEKKYSTRTRTVIAGDLNLMPFEPNLLDPVVLRSHNSSTMLSQVESFEKGHLTNHWFNPMWHYLTDIDSLGKVRTATGTYYRTTDDETHNWCLIDGFLVRSSLMRSINYSNCHILTGTSNDPFIKSVLLDKAEKLIVDDFSDHLPVMFMMHPILRAGTKANLV